MNDMQLNRAIAARLGWRMEYDADHTRFKLWHGDEYIDWYAEVEEDRAWAQALEETVTAGDYANGPRYGSAVPRWAQDEGAALRLWADLLAQHPREWKLGIGAVTDGPHWCVALNTATDQIGQTGDDLARELAELALRALESGAGG